MTLSDPFKYRDIRLALRLCTERVSRLSDPVVLSNEVIGVLHAVMGYERGAVVLRRERQDPLVLVAHCPGGVGAADQAAEFARVERLIRYSDGGVIRRVIATGQPMLLSDVGDAKDYVEGAAQICAEACVPMTVSGACIGALNVEADRAGFFDEDDLFLLSVVAALLAQHLVRFPVRHLS